MYISAPLQSIAYAVITKSVGSSFRVIDDWSGPREKTLSTVKREGILLALTTLFTTGIQLLFTKLLSSTLLKRPGLLHHELLMRAVVTAPALFFAEWISRKIAPKNYVSHPPANISPPIHFSAFTQSKNSSASSSTPTRALDAAAETSPAVAQASFYA